MKKGFTLVELLGVIIILGVIALITFPIINKSIKSSKEKALEQVINNIEDAAYKYSISNDIGYQTFYNKIELSTLVNAGILKDNIVNPVTDEQMQGCVLYKWVEEYKQYEFKYDENCSVKTIKDVVLSNFPYLETNGNGCVTPTDNNYSYMGGCYLKGSNQSGKDIFVSQLNGAPGLDSIDVINEKFFDSEGNFIAENFENWALTDGGISESDLTSAGVNTVFELIYGMTPEEWFAQQPLNNSLWYSGFLWRIMGINRDGTVRLITDENVTAIPWGARNTAQNWDNSYAKDWLNNYFYSRLKGNNIIKEEAWCSETTTSNSSARTTCTNNLSTETAKVGLITIDEYNLAGGSSSYLNIGQYQWTMTPYSSSRAWNVHAGDGNSNGNAVYTPDVLHAVINVNSGVTITGGNGTLGATWSSQSGPYILNEDKNVEVTGKLNEKSTSGEYVLFAEKKYRVVDKDSTGNTKLILDGYYEETSGTIYNMLYGSNNTFSTETGIGQKLNVDVLNWLVNNNETEKVKLVTNYTWYQNNFDKGQSYTISLNEENPTRSIQATVGLIRIGEMLSSQSSSILTKGYTTTSSYNNATTYWTMTPYTSSSNAWNVGGGGGSDYNSVSFTYGLRAVIVVNSDVTITGGNGTLGETWSSQAGPYILNEDKNVEVTGKLNEKATSGEYVMFAGRKYRVVDKDSNGNTKLILDGYYEEPSGTIYSMSYGSNNTFSTTTGIGQKLNVDVLNWLTNNSETEKGKLVTNYTWYQNNFDNGQSYTISLNEENPTRSIQATVGLIRIGEILSSQSSTILTNGYNDASSYNNTKTYWTMTPSTSTIFIIESSSELSNFQPTNYPYSTIRPVIAINKDVEIIGGTGTFSNPYQI